MMDSMIPFIAFHERVATIARLWNNGSLSAHAAMVDIRNAVVSINKECEDLLAARKKEEER